LFSTTNTTASLCVAAKLRASWKSPPLVLPSPMQVTHTESSPRIRNASAIPAAWSSCVVTGDPVLMMLWRRDP
jgi:hypothetical protein